MLKTWLNPKWRIWFLLGFANAAWIGLAWLYADRDLWLWLTPIALSINCLLFSYDYVLQFRAFTGHPLVGSDAWGILKSVHDLSLQLHVPEPEVFLIPRHSAQLFSLSKTRRHPRLYLTQGVVELLTVRELQAVLTYQLIAMREQYHVLNYWSTAVLDMCFRVGKLCERALAFVLGWSPPLTAWLISPGLWFVRLALVGAKDFDRLDKETALALDHPEHLAQALWKMNAYAHTRPWPEPWIFSHMCMVSPLLSSHRLETRQVQPPLAARLRNLVGRFPL